MSDVKMKGMTVTQYWHYIETQGHLANTLLKTWQKKRKEINARGIFLIFFLPRSSRLFSSLRLLWFSLAVQRCLQHVHFLHYIINLLYYITRVYTGLYTTLQYRAVAPTVLFRADLEPRCDYSDLFLLSNVCSRGCRCSKSKHRNWSWLLLSCFVPSL